MRVFPASFNWCFFFHRRQSDSKSPLVFRTLLSILADLNNAVIRVISILPLISSSSRVFCSKGSHLNRYLLFLSLIIIIIITHESFSHQLTLMVFHWRLSDSKSPQVSRTLLSILAVFNNVVVWMVSTRPPTLIIV